MTAPDPQHAPSSSRRPWRRLGQGALALLLVLLLFAAAARWLAPGWAAREAGQWAQARGYTLALGEVEIEPWALAASIGPYRLADAGGAELVAGERARVRVAFWPLVTGRVDLAELTLASPTLTLERAADGQWNWARFAQVASPAAPPDAAKEPLRLTVDDASVADGRVRLIDRQGSLREFDAQGLSLAVRDLSTESADGRVSLAARLPDGARLAWQGGGGLSPLKLQGTLSLTALKAASFWPWLAPHLRLAAPPAGSVSASTAYRFSLEKDAPELMLSALAVSFDNWQLSAPETRSELALGRLALTGGTLDLAARTLSFATISGDGLRLAGMRRQDGLIDWLAALPAREAAEAGKPQAKNGWQVALQKIRLADTHYALTDRSFVQPLQVNASAPELTARFRLDRGGDFTLDEAGGQIRALSIGSEGAEPVLTITEANLAGGRVDGAKARASLSTLELSGLDARVRRLRGGQLEAGRVFETASPAPKSGKATGPAWQLGYPSVTLQDSRVRWQDDSVARPVVFELTDIAGQAAPDGDGVAARIDARAGRGRLSVDGRLAGEAMQARVRGDALPLPPFAPYALAGTPLTLAAGSVSADLDARLNGARWQVSGAGSIDTLRVLEAGQRQPLLAWQRLGVQGVSADAQGVSIVRARLTRPTARFILDKERRSNVEKLFAGRPDSAARPPAGKGDAYRFNLRTLQVSGGALEFADLGMQPVFGTRIHDLSGSVLGLSSTPGRRATVSFDGDVDEYGDVRIRGRLQPFAVTDDLDMQLAFRNIPVGSLNPYSMNFAGWRVDDGRLSVDLGYRIDKRKLTADNRVVIKSLKLGKEIPDYQGTRLPLKLAVALLEDADGVIDLDLPVTGSLDDPKFSYGHLVWQAVRNVIVKVATAPFRALAALMGGEGFDEVYVVPGEAALTPPEREKLATLAKLLERRSQLTVAIGGGFDAKADRVALARARVDRAVLTAAGFAPPAGEPLPVPDLSDAAQRAAIKSVYADKIGRVALLRRIVELPDDDARYRTLLDEMVAAERVDDASLTALADARARAARAALLEADPSLASRVTLAPAKGVSADADGVPLVLTAGRVASPAPEASAPAAG
ncbi:DUF748 domain-containing protein [Crenobacter caeni]|uniref:DUF748 domain-containing protein n=1 Tax=Crenobacter caeni TaxID=2705474 RepID=A0A6B2KSN1_9NEIS|nr:DUF748 domain-containing protein [Crenobacter caeni]NDV12947.1 DUF748 domain-containing protein [Crenobacter caeni]